MLSYQAIQPKRIGTSTDSEKKDKFRTYALERGKTPYPLKYKYR